MQANKGEWATDCLLLWVSKALAEWMSLQITDFYTQRQQEKERLFWAFDWNWHMNSWQTCHYASFFSTATKVGKSSCKSPVQASIASVVKSLPEKGREAEFQYLNFSELRMYLHAEDILSLEKFNEYMSASLSDQMQARDYIKNVMPKRGNKKFYWKFLVCLCREKEHSGHEELLQFILRQCGGKVSLW